MIQHLVISGSGPNGLSQVAVIQEYEQQGLLSLDALDKVYGCSAGAIIGMMLLLKIPLDATVEYIIKRPWNKFAKLDFFDMNERGGIMDCEKIREMCVPLFMANDIPLDITFLQAKERSAVDLHIFATNLETFKRVEFNIETFPNMPLLTAVMLSSAVPPVFSTGSYEGVPYADGGLSDNFPLASLLEHASKPDPSAVLCINMTGPMPVYKTGAPLMELMAYIVTHAILQMSDFHTNHAMGQKTCPHYIYHETQSIWSKTLWDKFLFCEDERRSLYEKGREIARAHLAKLSAPLNEEAPSPC